MVSIFFKAHEIVKDAEGNDVSRDVCRVFRILRRNEFIETLQVWFNIYSVYV